MKQFIQINELSKQEIVSLLDKACLFKKTGHYPCYDSQSIANLFYEDSTRTRVSFELAQKKMLMQVVNLDLTRSSENKGETMVDTINNLSAMGIKLMVLRHWQNNLFDDLEAHCPGVQFINAGNGTEAHPSQAMLDVMTIMEKKPDLSKLKISIIGDIKHSRVANSLQMLFSKLQIKELVLVAPDIWQPSKVHVGTVTDDLKKGIQDADVVMTLRVQRERLEDNEYLDLTDYRERYALTRKHLAFAKPDALVMHPGPINRGIEIDAGVADGSQSVILEQVTNGVFMRMAIIDKLLSSI